MRLLTVFINKPVRISKRSPWRLFSSQEDRRGAPKLLCFETSWSIWIPNPTPSMLQQAASMLRHGGTLPPHPQHEHNTTICFHGCFRCRVFPLSILAHVCYSRNLGLGFSKRFHGPMCGLLFSLLFCGPPEVRSRHPEALHSPSKA